MRRMHVFRLFAVVAVTITACQTTVRGSGNVVSESREVSDFDRVELIGAGRLLIAQDELESLTVEAEDNIMPLIETKVRNRTLFLGFTAEANRKRIEISHKIIFNLSLRNISYLGLTGSGSVAASEIDSEQLTVDLSGSGDVTLQSLRAQDLTVDISGSGQVDLGGEVADQNVGVSGSGEYHGGNLSSLNASVELSGSGEVTVWAIRDLVVDISGAGDVGYFGDPTIREDISGSGNLRRLGGR